MVNLAVIGGLVSSKDLLLCDLYYNKKEPFGWRSGCYNSLANLTMNNHFDLGYDIEYGSKSIHLKDKNALWITGLNRDNLTKLVSTEGSRPGPEMPYALEKHCIVRINASTLMFLGGVKFPAGLGIGGEYSRDSWLYNQDNDSWIKGNSMINMVTND